MTSEAEFWWIAAAPFLFGAACLLLFRRFAGTGGRGRWPVLLLGNALLLLFLTSVVLVAFETQLRFFYDASDGDNRTRVSKRWFERHWTLNSLGLRDDVEYALKRTPGRRRVSFVGDSFTAGHGVDVELRYVNRLRARQAEWELHAIAIPGLETQSQIELLGRLLRRGYELDVVVLAYYLENIGRWVPELRKYFERAGQPLPQPWKFLVDHSFAIDTFFYRGQTRLQYGRGYWSDVYERAYAGPAWEQQKAAFVRFRGLVLSHGGSFAALTFPTLTGVAHRREMVEQVATFWAELGVAHLDLLPVLEPYPSRELAANPHDGHPSAFAHALAADAIERFLHERQLAEAPPRP